MPNFKFYLVRSLQPSRSHTKLAISTVCLVMWASRVPLVPIGVGLVWNFLTLRGLRLGYIGFVWNVSLIIFPTILLLFCLPLASHLLFPCARYPE